MRDRLERAADIVEIQQLAYRYAVSVDSRDIHTLVSLFAERQDENGTMITRDFLFKRFSGLIARSPVSILNVGNHLVDLDPDDTDKATGTVYCRAEIEDGERWLVQQIAYIDEYARIDGMWRFWKRNHLLFYGADMLQRPIGLQPAGNPENYDGKGSMPEYWETYREFHHSIAQG